jgi:predicted amidohydrolase YtcJ
MNGCSHANTPETRARFAGIAGLSPDDLARALDDVLRGQAPGGAEARAHLFTGGPIYTMTDDHPTAEAMLVVDDTITAVGTLAHVRACAPAGTRTVDLAGRTLLPGFVDPHMHFVASATELAMTLDLSPPADWRAYTTDYVKRLLRETVAKAPSPFTVITGQGFDPSQLQDRWMNLTVDVFDDILGSRPNPVIIQSGSGHLTYANRHALRLAGVHPTSPPPVPGGKVATFFPGNLEASGIFVEMSAQALINAALKGTIEPRQVLASVVEICRTAVAAGNTFINDAATGIAAGAAERAIIAGVIGALRYPRVGSAMFVDEWNWPSGLSQIVTSSPSFENPMFRRQAVKLFADGSDQGATGLQRRSYETWALDRTQHAHLGTQVAGNADCDPSTLSTLISAANGRGFQVMIHANGDGAIDNALAAYEGATGLDPRLRHRIEHCSILHDDQVARMKRVGVTPSFLIEHVRLWGAVLANMLGTDRADLLDRCATAYAEFGVFSLHSDYLVSGLVPLQRVQDAVTRIVRATDKVLNADERVPVDVALKAQTRFAAWHCHADDLVGTLEAGKKGDLVVLGKDPHVVAPMEIAQIPIAETWVDGRKVFPR